MLSTLSQPCYNKSASELLGQPCNKSYISLKLVTSCQEFVTNMLTNKLGQAERTQIVDSILADLLQVVRFLRACDLVFVLCWTFETHYDFLKDVI